MPAKLRARRLTIEKSYGTPEWTAFWKWLFEMGMAIHALKVGRSPCSLSLGSTRWPEEYDPSQACICVPFYFYFVSLVPRVPLALFAWAIPWHLWEKRLKYSIPSAFPVGSICTLSPPTLCFISLLQVNAPSSSVRTVPLDAAIQLMDACLSVWWLYPKLKAFSLEVHKQAFTKDLWVQIGRFMNLVSALSVPEIAPPPLLDRWVQIERFTNLISAAGVPLAFHLPEKNWRSGTGA